MTSFKIRPAILISYFDHDKGFWRTLRNSSKRRDRNPFMYLIRKSFNTILFRLSYFCPLNSVRIKLHRLRGVHIGENVYIGVQCNIDNAYPEYVYIEDNVSISTECSIIAHSNPYSHFSDVTPAKADPVVIRRGAWIGIRSLILPGVEVGENAIISAGSVVVTSVPSRTVVSGNPAKIVAKNIPVK